VPTPEKLIALIFRKKLSKSINRNCVEDKKSVRATASKYNLTRSVLQGRLKFLKAEQLKSQPGCSTSKIHVEVLKFKGEIGLKTSGVFRSRRTVAVRVFCQSV
jgi:hypothetical protein